MYEYVQAAVSLHNLTDAYVAIDNEVHSTQVLPSYGGALEAAGMSLHDFRFPFVTSFVNEK